jgi:hypothetical protein
VRCAAYLYQTHFVDQAVGHDRVANDKIGEHWGAANTLEALDAIGALSVGAR